MNTIEKFYKITQLDLRPLIEDLSIFIQNNAFNISESYSDSSVVIDPSIYVGFSKLEARINTFFLIFAEFSQNFKNTEYWNLLQQMEEIHSYWQTIRSAPKWNRSFITTFGEHTSETSIEYQGKQNESINKIHRDRIGDSDGLDGWYAISVQNKLTEDKYSLNEGGVNLQLSSTSSGQISRFTEDVIDTMTGKSIYGKDINRSFSIDEDTQDIDILGHEQTLIQSIQILLTLSKEDNPYSPEHGIQKSLFVGSSRAIFNIPILRRQLAENFTKDSTITDFEITDIAFDQDNIIVDTTIKTILGESIFQRATL